MKSTDEIIERVNIIYLLIEHLNANYKKKLFSSDIAKDVITYEAIEAFNFIPNEVEMGWIIHTLKK